MIIARFDQVFPLYHWKSYFYAPCAGVNKSKSLVTLVISLQQLKMDDFNIPAAF